MAKSKRSVYNEKVGYVDLPEACQAGWNGFENHWACMQGHWRASDGGGGHRVVAHPGLLPLGFAGCLRECEGLPTGFGDRRGSAGCKRLATHGGSTKCLSALGGWPSVTGGFRTCV